MSGNVTAIDPATWVAVYGHGVAPSVLRLLARLVDVHRHFEGFAAAAEAGAAHRRRAEIVQADGDAHMGLGGADAVGRVEADPAEVLDIGFDPGVAGVLRSRRRRDRNVRRHSAPVCRAGAPPR